MKLLNANLPKLLERTFFYFMPFKITSSINKEYAKTGPSITSSYVIWVYISTFSFFFFWNSRCTSIENHSIYAWRNNYISTFCILTIYTRTCYILVQCIQQMNMYTRTTYALVHPIHRNTKPYCSKTPPTKHFINIVWDCLDQVTLPTTGEDISLSI